MPVGQPTSTTPNFSCTIVTSDPATNTLEAALPGNLEPVTVITTPVAFRWPVAGEVWQIRRINNQFYLGEPYPVTNSPSNSSAPATTATLTINTMEAGDIALNSPTGVIHVLGSSDGSTDFTFTANGTIPTILELEDASTIAVPSIANVYTITLGANRTMGSPEFTPHEGQRITFKISQPNSGGTYTYNVLGWTGYHFGTTIPQPTLGGSVGQIDYIEFIWDSVKSRWNCISVAQGF